MKFALLCKRHYTNKDLIADRFGRLFHLPFQLVNMGHEGLVVAGDLRTLKKEKVDIAGIRFYSMPLSFARLYSFIPHNYHKIKKFEPDVLIASGDSYLGYIGLKISQKLNIPFVFDVYDDYTVFGSNKIPGMKTLFHKAVENADLVVTSSVPLRKQLNSINKNILVIENGFDPLLFRSLPKEETRAQLNIPLNDTVVGYFGSLAEHLGLKVLLNAAEILRNQLQNLRLLIAGHDGMNLDFAAHKIDYRGFLPQHEIPALINASDIVVIPYLPSKQVQQSNACKIAEYTACQVPVVATDVSNHQEIFSKIPGAICEPGNPEAMASAILSQLKSPTLLPYQTKLTWTDLAQKLSNAINEILHKRNMQY